MRDEIRTGSLGGRPEEVRGLVSVGPPADEDRPSLHAYAYAPRHPLWIRLPTGAWRIILFACVAVLGACLVIGRLSLPPGIGDPEQAKLKIKDCRTMDDVRAALGEPHGVTGDHYVEWTYRCDLFGGTLFRVYFRPDGRFRYSEWWVH